jgi:hypothetical protein
MERWFWNIAANPEYKKFVRKELQNGRLRQGWGYDSRLDLRRIDEKIQQSITLDNEEKIAWERCSLMLKGIEAEDLVVVKNVPNDECFTIVRVDGGYAFRIDPETGDLGHFLPVTAPRTFNKESTSVPGSFMNALNREQYPIRVTYKHRDAVLALYIRKPDTQDTEPEEFKSRLGRWRQSLALDLRNNLSKDLNHRHAERLILNLLERDGLEVKWTAGPTEKGADLIGTVKLGYGLSTDMAVQIKMHRGVDNDLTGLDQLEAAFRERHVQSALLVSFGDEIGRELSERLDSLKKMWKIDVLYGTELYSRLVELVADSSYTPS